MSTTTIDADAAQLVIGGERHPTEERFDVLNPATGAVLADAPECSGEQLDLAFSVAREAGHSWKLDPEARRAALAAAAGEVMGSVEALTALLVAEQGKPRHEAKLEVEACAYWLGYYARLQPPREVIRDDERAHVELLRRPVGVVAAITPWNFPLLLSCWKIGPALAAGCTMVLKPSPFTPLATLRLGEVLGRALPPGVLNVVAGGDALGPRMTAHPLVRKISFTGSVATGRRVVASAVEDLKRVTLELGGNDPAILLDDVDPAAIARRLYWSAFSNAGQICCAVKRVYVPERIYDDVVAALAEQARSTPVGDGAQAGTMMGPVNNPPQRDRVRGLISEAIDAGAEALVGAAPEGEGGYFVAPTILAGARAGMRVVDEEQFGPALPVIAYRDLDDAVEQANGTEYGLCGSVWGVDRERAADTAARLECGTAWINTHMVNDPAQPFGGWRHSGLGVENGLPGLDAFTELQVVHEAIPRARG